MPPGQIVDFKASSNESLEFLKMNANGNAPEMLPKSMKEMSLGEEDPPNGDDEASLGSLDIVAPDVSSVEGEDEETNHENAYQDSWGEGLGIGALPGEEDCDSDDPSSYNNNNKLDHFRPQQRRATEPLMSTTDSTKKKKRSLFSRKNKNKNQQDRTLDSSSHSSFSRASSRSSSSAYAGPKPMGPDGKPLKSCMSNSNLRSLHCPSDEESLGVGFGAEDDAESASTSPPAKPMKRNISFQNIEVREYERAVGDHPCVSSGPPLTIGWKHTDGVSVSLDDYENAKPEARTRAEMMIPRRERENLLRTEANATTGEIMKATKSVNITKGNRKKTAATNDVHHIHEATEFINRRLRRVTSGKNKDQEQEDLWENAQQVAMKKYMNGELDPSLIQESGVQPPTSIAFSPSQEDNGLSF